ncbi:MAG TPA: TonB-dependent receptor [Burkholderiaceae bacterium]|nr:TonB-dependent receptor [Burkholderiaceae bacterium]
MPKIARRAAPAPASVACRATLGLIGPLLALALPLARAQNAAPPGTLQTVTVTAERRTENIKDVPSSVSIIAGEKLDVLNSSGEDLRALSGRVPSLNIESSFGRAFPRFYLRGYGNTDFRLNASQPVSLVYDDVVQESPILKGFPAFDLERIEVLAGPQGTLFGRNTPGGVVKFDSVQPSQSQEGYLSATVGRFGTVNLEGAFNLPLSGAWASRISLQTQNRDDWVRNTAPVRQTDEMEGYNDNALRAQLLYKPGSDFSALFNLHGRDLKGSARLFRANIIKQGSNALVDDFDPYSISIDGKNEQKLQTYGGSARLKWALGSVNLYSITGYETVHAFSRGDVDGGYGASFAPPSGPGLILFPLETADGIRGHGQLTQEFRVESATPGPLKWQAGLYYFHEKYEVDTYDFNTLAGGVQDGFVPTSQKSDSYAVFGSVNYELTPALKLRAGLRYTHDKKDLETQAAPGVIATNGLSQSRSDSKVSWDVSGTYALTPDVNLYARIATGYRGSSIQPPSTFSALTSAAPETVLSYEGGAKADLFDKAARVSLSAYQYDVKDQQLTAVGGASNATQLVSAEKMTGRGVEATLDAYVTERLFVSVSGSYNHTQIKDPNLAVGVCAQCTVTDPLNGSGNALIDGNPLPNAPRYVANLNLRYGIPTASGGEWYVYTDWSYRSKVNFFLYESVEFTGPATTIGGLRLGYIWGNGKYEAAVFARNVTNQIRVNGGIDFNNLTGFINEPRFWGAQFKAQF